MITIPKKILNLASNTIQWGINHKVAEYAVHFPMLLTLVGNSPYIQPVLFTAALVDATVHYFADPEAKWTQNIKLITRIGIRILVLPWSACHLCQQIAMRTNLLFLTSSESILNTSFKAGLFSWWSMMVVAGAAPAAIGRLNQGKKPDLDPGTRVLQLVVNVALVFFSAPRSMFITISIFNLCTLYKIYTSSQERPKIEVIEEENGDSKTSSPTREEIETLPSTSPNSSPPSSVTAVTTSESSQTDTPAQGEQKKDGLPGARLNLLDVVPDEKKKLSTSSKRQNPPTQEDLRWMSDDDEDEFFELENGDDVSSEKIDEAAPS